MPTGVDGSDYDAGLAALAVQDWSAATRHLEHVAAHDPRPEVLEALGEAYFWEDRPEAMDVREDAYRGYRDRGDQRGAARLAMALAFDHVSFRAEEAVAQGWLELASRALADVPLAPEHGLLATWVADFALTGNDTATADRTSALAVQIGVELGEPDIELMGQAQQGLVRVLRGDVDAGMRLLDASVAAASAGEIRDVALAGYVCCYLIAACRMVHDLARAAQWCDQLDRHSRRTGLRGAAAPVPDRLRRRAHGDGGLDQGRERDRESRRGPRRQAAADGDGGDRQAGRPPTSAGPLDRGGGPAHHGRGASSGDPRSGQGRAGSRRRGRGRDPLGTLPAPVLLRRPDRSARRSPGR